MMDIDYFAETITLLYGSLQHIAKGDAEADDIRRWINLTAEAIPALENLMTSLSLRADKQKAQTCLMHLHTIKRRLNNELKRGGDLQVHEVEKIKWDDFHSAFDSRIRSGVITNLAHKDIISFLNDSFNIFDYQIQRVLKEFDAVKVNTMLSAEFIVHKNDIVMEDVKYFSTENHPIYQTTDLKEFFKEQVSRPIQRQMEEFQERDSGWTLRQILSLTININKFNPMRGSSYIPLPDVIMRKKACVNVKNDDDQCFKWAILSSLYPQHNSNRVQLYEPYEEELNFKKINFPVQPKDISKFERQNEISINLYILKKQGNNFNIAPCHLTSTKKEKHVNLLLIQDRYEDEDENEDENEDGNEVAEPPMYHYVWIKNLSRLVSKDNKKNKTYICDRCLHFFRDQNKLNEHEIDCGQLNKCKILLPNEKEKFVQFKNFIHQERVPYIIYADFECLLKPVERPVEKKNKNAFQEHQAYSIGYYIKSSFDDNLSEYKSHRQENNDDEETPAEWFVRNLAELSNKLHEMYENYKKMQLSPSDEDAFRTARNCHICRRPFKNEDIKVRDHNRLTGDFRVAAHQGCNLNYLESRFIPVVFHNLTGYDAHFIINEIATSQNLKGRVRLIAENHEKYISFIKFVDGLKIKFRFIDSFRFMPSSLEKLASYLDPININIVRKEFETDGYVTPEQYELLMRKGVFPYDYVSSFEKLKEKSLPSKDDFYSKLTDSHISNEEYEHAQNVWEKLGIKSLGHYSDLYLKTDVLLLADIFENFRTTCITAYGLDPAHYYTTPGLTWDAMLKFTQVKLELLTDIDMLMMVERGIRGGISQCSNRYAEANNEYMEEGYNPDKEKSFLLYYDVNNLYGWAMTQSLPFGDFKWIENPQNINVFEINDDEPYGFILEVDLMYPEGLHNQHMDLPMCPEHLSAPGSKQEKLMTTLHDKERYVIHYRALKQALSHGLRLKRIHRALKFQQKRWLKPYVDLNTEKRKQAKNEFEKLFFKLMINAVYGKTMENERKRRDIKLVNKWNGRFQAEAYIGKPNCHSCSIFSENLVAIQFNRTEMTIKKPLYIGLSVLDLSKTCVYDFHYSFMRKRLGDQCKVLYTDTDSLIYEVKNINMYNVMKENIHRFDTSDYAEDNQFGLPRVNKKELGLMKDECCGNVLLKFIGLRSKMYCLSIQSDKDEIVKKAKGVKASVLKTSITFEDYEESLFNNAIIKRVQRNIRSRLHVVRTEEGEKIALSPHDDKRCLIPGETDTLPWGHYKCASILAADERMQTEATRNQPTDAVMQTAADTAKQTVADTAKQAVADTAKQPTTNTEKQSTLVGRTVQISEQSDRELIQAEPPSKRPRLDQPTATIESELELEELLIQAVQEVEGRTVQISEQPA